MNWYCFLNRLAQWLGWSQTDIGHYFNSTIKTVASAYAAAKEADHAAR